MPDPYTTLGLTPDVTDEQARRRYLELIREFTPEQHPAKFAAVRAAYELVKDLDARVRYRLFDHGADDTIEAIIEEAACRTPRRRLGLTTLLSDPPPSPR